MRQSAASARLLLASLAVALAFFRADAAATAHRAEALRRCREQFGAPLDAARNLFEVNRWYALEVIFDSRGRLSELNVVPKRWLAESHPEWDEPPGQGLENFWAKLLTGAEYEKLLARLDAVEPKGRLLEAGNPVVVTNMTAPYRHVYERAELTQGKVVDLRRGDGAPPLVRYFKVRYVDGRKLLKKRRGLRPPEALPPAFGGTTR